MCSYPIGKYIYLYTYNAYVIHVCALDTVQFILLYIYSINEESEISDNENIHTIAKVCMYPCIV